MKVVGVIAEYNPFHLGHAFHLAQARRLTGADYVIAAMSGNYVQRGAPAMFDKFTRARAALENGADLVLELPLSTAAGSAEYFASGAVSLLQHTGVVTDLCFGSECGELSLLEYPAKILADEPFAYRELLKRLLKSGAPYPKARAEALRQYDSRISADILKEPNNLLGLEYLKAVRRSGGKIRPHTIRRIGSGYHGQQLHDTHPASAGSIRRALLQSGGHFTPDICRQLPSAEIYVSYQGKRPVTEDAFSGHLFVLQTPLFRVRNKKENFYCYSEEERQRAVKRCGASAEITRFKGLGEISPDEFKDLIGENMRLDRVRLTKDDPISDLLEFYMGKNTFERQGFIIDNLRIEEDLVEEDIA